VAALRCAFRLSPNAPADKLALSSAAMRPGLIHAAWARIAELERENRELRRANQIPEEASVVFAKELDRPGR
jgi:transposase